MEKTCLSTGHARTSCGPSRIQKAIWYRYQAKNSSLLRLLGNADALIYRPAHAEAARAGTPCATLPLPK
ncbi:hypothetical protein ABWH92_13500 [Ahrensia marina]|uniref:hypothetical protein n=1 Tax=Ahrensia marina TaxID=1514904 RepID=UPI0035CF2D75